MTTQPSDSQSMLEQLREINQWLRFLALPALRERLAATLITANEKRIYQA